MSKIQWYWCVITKILIRGYNSSQSALCLPAAGREGWRNNWFKSFHLTNLLIIHFLHEGTVWIIRWNWEIASVWEIRKWWRIPRCLSIQVINWLYRFLFFIFLISYVNIALMLHNFYMGFDIQYHVHFQHQRLHGFSDLRLSFKNYTKMTKQGTKKAMKNNNRLKFSFFPWRQMRWG